MIPRRARIVVGLLAAPAMGIVWSAIAMPAAADDRVQGRWTYTQRSDRDVTEYMATTPSVQDTDTWLLVACRTDERLTVAVMRTTEFGFPLAPSAPVTLHAAGLPDLSVLGKSWANQIVIDPRVMRHVMPLLI